MTRNQEAAIARQCDHENLIGQLQHALAVTLTLATSPHLFDPAQRAAAFQGACDALAKAEKC